MIKWLKFHLSVGKTDTGTQLLDAKLVRHIHHVTTAVHKSFVGSMSKPSHPVDDFDIGYGMSVSEYRGKFTGFDPSIIVNLFNSNNNRI